MPERSTPYKEELISQSYTELLERIGMYDGILYHIHLILEREYTASSCDPSHYLGNTLAFYNPYTNYLRTAGLYEVSATNLKERLDDLKRQINNYYCAQAYEALEGYILDLAAFLIIKEPELAFQIDDRLGFYKYESCRKMLSRYYASNLDLYKLIVKLCPSLSETLTQKTQFEHYSIWLQAFTFSRHIITHSNSRFSEKQLHKIRACKAFFLDCGIDEDIMNINLSVKGRDLIDKTAEFATFIYKPVIKCFEGK